MKPDALDAECNALQVKLDAMRAQKQDRSDNMEYMNALYALRDLCRQRIGNINAVTQ